MSLPTTALGTTGMEITRVGYGAWAIGGGDWIFGWGEQDDADSVGAIRAALTAGVNWIDTAAVYGLGHSEEVVARALRDIPISERPYVFTKCGMINDPDRPYERAQRLLDEDHVRSQVDESLRRLGVDRIDLLQVHWPSEDGTPIEDYWGTLLALRDEGKVRSVGLSNHSVAELDRAEAVGHVETLQPPLSLIRRESAVDLLDWCAAHGTGVIVYAPMQSGLLTGAFTQGRLAKLDPKDWRGGNAEFTTNLPRNLVLVDKLREIGARHGVGPGAVAIAWTLSFPQVSGAIVGARRADQVAGWIPAATLTLDAATLDEIAATLESSGAGAGPVRPPR